MTIYFSNTVLDTACCVKVSDVHDFVHALTLNKMAFHLQFMCAVCLVLGKNSDCFYNIVNIGLLVF